MKQYSRFIAVVIVPVLLSSCLGSGGGTSAPPPTNVAAAPKDNRAIISWDMAPGIDYWVYKANGTNVSPQNCSSMLECSTVIHATSPIAIYGLTDGTTYSFSVNARVNGGPGGQGSAPVTAVPRLAGGEWSNYSAVGTSDLHGVMYGYTPTYGSVYIAVGTAGAAYSSGDGVNWAPISSLVAGANLNAVAFDGTYLQYLVVGSGGVVYFLPSTSLGAWGARTSNTTSDLYALATNGTGYVVAAGANGTIIYSTDCGATWTVESSGTSRPLYGVAYGSGSTLGYIYVAVGQSGTILYSLDAVTWVDVTATSGTTSDLKSVIYSAEAAVFVAVGANGTVVTSSDGINWTSQTSISSVSTASLNALAYTAGRRFIAVASDGNIYYNEYANAGVNWTQVTPKPTTSAIYTVTAGGLLDYSALGANGLNLHSD